MKSSFLLKGIALAAGLSTVLLVSSCSNVQPVGVGNSEVTQTAATVLAPTGVDLDWSSSYGTPHVHWHNNAPIPAEIRIDRSTDNKNWYDWDHVTDGGSEYWDYEYPTNPKHIKVYYRIRAENGASHSAWVIPKHAYVYTPY